MSGRKRDVRRTWPTNAFAAIVDADGSITQGEALANAATEIRALPDVGVKGIDAAISAIGSLVALADHDSLDADDLQRILGHVDRILMLSHAFGFDRLERISRYIGDLCLGFSRLDNRPAEPVSVFVRAAMLFQPDRTDMSDQDAETVFAELQKGANRYMGLAPKPCNEAFRQSVLDSLDIMESPAEAAFDRLTQMASKHFKMPIALISLIDHDRQWFKAKTGLDAEETGRNIDFCAHTIMDDQPLVILDAQQDDRFASNPLVVSDPNVRFYAGAPLISPENVRLGMFCIIDSAPREKFDEGDLATLQRFASKAVELMYERAEERKQKQPGSSRLKNQIVQIQARTQSTKRHLDLAAEEVHGPIA